MPHRGADVDVDPFPLEFANRVAAKCEIRKETVLGLVIHGSTAAKVSATGYLVQFDPTASSICLSCDQNDTHFARKTSLQRVLVSYRNV